MKECEKMLVAMEIAGWLNDSSLVLQAVVQTYGLLVPLIQAEIVTDPIMEVSVYHICSGCRLIRLILDKVFIVVLLPLLRRKLRMRIIYV